MDAQRKKTGGRQKGTRNKLTAQREAEIAASGLTPLDYMLRILRDENEDTMSPRRNGEGRSALLPLAI